MSRDYDSTIEVVGFPLFYHAMDSMAVASENAWAMLDSRTSWQIEEFGEMEPAPVRARKSCVFEVLIHTFGISCWNDSSCGWNLGRVSLMVKQKLFSCSPFSSFVGLEAGT